MEKDLDNEDALWAFLIHVPIQDVVSFLATNPDKYKKMYSETFWERGVDMLLSLDNGYAVKIDKPDKERYFLLVSYTFWPEIVRTGRPNLLYHMLEITKDYIDQHYVPFLNSFHPGVHPQHDSTFEQIQTRISIIQTIILRAMVVANRTDQDELMRRLSRYNDDIWMLRGFRSLPDFGFKEIWANVTERHEYRRQRDIRLDIHSSDPTRYKLRNALFDVIDEGTINYAFKQIVDLGTEEEKRQALLLAVMNDNVAVAKYLIDQDIDITQMSRRLLSHAMMKNSPWMANLIIETLRIQAEKNKTPQRYHEMIESCKSVISMYVTDQRVVLLSIILELINDKDLERACLYIARKKHYYEVEEMIKTRRFLDEDILYPPPTPPSPPPQEPWLDDKDLPEDAYQ